MGKKTVVPAIYSIREASSHATAAAVPFLLLMFKHITTYTIDNKLVNTTNTAITIMIIIIMIIIVISNILL